MWTGHNSMQICGILYAFDNTTNGQTVIYITRNLWKSVNLFERNWWDQVFFQIEKHSYFNLLCVSSCVKQPCPVLKIHKINMTHIENKSQKQNVSNKL